MFYCTKRASVAWRGCFLLHDSRSYFWKENSSRVHGKFGPVVCVRTVFVRVEIIVSHV